MSAPTMTETVFRQPLILYAVQTARFSSCSTFSMGLAKASEARRSRQAALAQPRIDDMLSDGRSDLDFDGENIGMVVVLGSCSEARPFKYVLIRSSGRTQHRVRPFDLDASESNG
jgi:hypothetical protein